MEVHYWRDCRLEDRLRHMGSIWGAQGLESSEADGSGEGPVCGFRCGDGGVV
jgi:hypothetical protein